MSQAAQERWDRIVAEVGDGEPTDNQYRDLWFIAYSDPGIHFASGNVNNEYTVRIFKGKVQGFGSDTGRAYWAYRKALDKASAEE